MFNFMDIVAGFFSMFGWGVADFFGISSEYSSIVAPIASCFTLITIILAVIFLKEKLVPNQILGIIAIISGLVLISI